MRTERRNKLHSNHWPHNYRREVKRQWIYLWWCQLLGPGSGVVEAIKYFLIDIPTAHKKSHAARIESHHQALQQWCRLGGGPGSRERTMWRLRHRRGRVLETGEGEKRETGAGVSNPPPAALHSSSTGWSDDGWLDGWLAGQRPVGDCG